MNISKRKYFSNEKKKCQHSMKMRTKRRTKESNRKRRSWKKVFASIFLVCLQCSVFWLATHTSHLMSVFRKNDIVSHFTQIHAKVQMKTLQPENGKTERKNENKNTIARKNYIIPHFVYLLIWWPIHNPKPKDAKERQIKKLKSTPK